MPKYAVLIYSDETEVWTPEQEKAVMDGYGAYSDLLTTSGKDDGGEVLHRRAPRPRCGSATGRP